MGKSWERNWHRRVAGERKGKSGNQEKRESEKEDGARNEQGGDGAGVQEELHLDVGQRDIGQAGQRFRQGGALEGLIMQEKAGKGKSNKEGGEGSDEPERNMLFSTYCQKLCGRNTCHPRASPPQSSCIYNTSCIAHPGQFVLLSQDPQRGAKGPLLSAATSTPEMRM